MTMVPLDQLRAALRGAGVGLTERGTLPTQITGITDDSRAVVPGGVFIAVRGTRADGHDHLASAERAGAAMVIVEDATRTTLPAIIVPDARRAAPIAAAGFYAHPARALTLLGVTGTNGKTTTVGMLRHLLDAPEAPAASIGTLGVLIGSAGVPLDGGSGLTTPGPIELQRVLRALVDAGARRVAMEVSSHALHQGRVDGIAFAAGVFTNLTRDHLDYHGTMEAYFAAKALLIDALAADGVAVVNADDRAWDALPPASRSLRFASENPAADVRAAEVAFTPRGSAWVLHASGASYPVTLPLIGDFNVINAVGAAAAAISVGVAPATVAARLATLPQVPGRLEIIGEHPTVLRDYAHTPDALERALLALRPFTPGRLIALFGCGGDRDPGKRPMMGAIAHQFADAIVVTSDNPRTEDPERILDQICAVIPDRRYTRIEDRRAAIAAAIAMADPARDVVLLAGKGHEDYQIRGTTKLPFDEAAIVRELMGAA
ncbi:MAG: UDP-N-acetylmuramoyl-L-alanyl-D-glutamate--2,6-diaminopimelate ligase [Gemmatimonadaceae bacterium]|nr:UDP-N-acetylmuramoyl-L-alanyl-D-glutamate--2,6-diaminopimelate ligase [Gemmatimonadaceae bacterium]